MSLTGRAVLPVRPIANLFNPFRMNDRPWMGEGRESLVYNRKRAAPLARTMSAGGETLSSRSTAIEMNGYTCHSPHRALFRASLEDRTRSGGLCLCLFPSRPSFAASPTRRRTPYPVLHPRVVSVLCVSEAEETRRADPPIEASLR